MPIVTKILRASHPIMTAIKELPFQKELVSGTLSNSTFMNFLDVDVRYYLPQFSRALHIIQNRLKNSEYAAKFATLHQMNEGYIDYIHSSYHITKEPSSIHTIFQSTNETQEILRAYVIHIINMTTHASIPEAIASVAACLKLYVQLGEQLPADISTENPYAVWLESYRDRTFINNTNDMLDLLNTLCSSVEADSNEEKQVIDSYMRSMEFEFKLYISVYPQDLEQLEQTATEKHATLIPRPQTF